MLWPVPPARTRRGFPPARRVRAFLTLVLCVLAFGCRQEASEERTEASLGLEKIAVSFCKTGWEEVASYMEEWSQREEESEKRAATDATERKIRDMMSRAIEGGSLQRGDELATPIIQGKRRADYVKIGLFPLGGSLHRFFGQITLGFSDVLPAPTSPWGRLNQSRPFSYLLTVEMIYGQYGGWDTQNRRYEEDSALAANYRWEGCDLPPPTGGLRAVWRPFLEGLLEELGIRQPQR